MISAWYRLMTGELNQPLVTAGCRFAIERELDLPICRVGQDPVSTIRRSVQSILLGFVTERLMRTAYMESDLLETVTRNLW